MSVEAWALNENWDLFLDGEGQIAQTSDRDQVRLNVSQRLKSYLGDFFLDRTHGVPWFQSVFVAPANIPLSESIIKKTILETESVISLLDFDFDYDSQNRVLKFIKFKIVTEFGIVEGSI